MKILLNISVLALYLGAIQGVSANTFEIQLKAKDLMIQRCKSIFVNSEWQNNRSLVALHPERSKQVEAYEILSAGTILSGSEKMGQLEDGAYVYLIDSKGQLIYSARTPAEISDPQRHLVTHRSLAKYLSDVFGKTPKIIAAGEFFITNGRVSEVNNKSGTYRGGLEPLNYAVVKLGDYGLGIEYGTFVRDFSKAQLDIRHLDENNYSLLLTQYRNTSGFALLTNLYARLAEAYPDAKPGHMNVALLQQKLGDLMTAQLAKTREIRKSAPDSVELKIAKDEVQILFLEDYVIKSLETEGIPLVLWGIDNKYGGEAKLKILVKKIEDSFLVKEHQIAQ